jgi:hypothetical protein
MMILLIAVSAAAKPFLAVGVKTRGCFEYIPPPQNPDIRQLA